MLQRGWLASSSPARVLPHITGCSEKYPRKGRAWNRSAAFVVPFCSTTVEEGAGVQLMPREEWHGDGPGRSTVLHTISQSKLSVGTIGLQQMEG